MAEPYALTPSDITTLRTVMRNGFVRDAPGDIGLVQQFAACVVYSPASKHYHLHSGGFTVATSADERVILACLRNERHEKGYMQRVLSAEFTPEEAARYSPEEMALARSRQSALAASARFAREAQEDADRAKRRAASKLPETPQQMAATSILDLLG